MIFSSCFMCFVGQYSDLEIFKCSSRATLRCLEGRLWPAGRTLPRPALACPCPIVMSYKMECPKCFVGHIRQIIPTNCNDTSAKLGWALTKIRNKDQLQQRIVIIAYATDLQCWNYYQFLRYSDILPGTLLSVLCTQRYVTKGNISGIYLL